MLLPDFIFTSEKSLIKISANITHFFSRIVKYSYQERYVETIGNINENLHLWKVKTNWKGA